MLYVNKMQCSELANNNFTVCFSSFHFTHTHTRRMPFGSVLCSLTLCDTNLFSHLCHSLTSMCACAFHIWWIFNFIMIFVNKIVYALTVNSWKWSEKEQKMNIHNTIEKWIFVDFHHSVSLVLAVSFPSSFNCISFSCMRWIVYCVVRLNRK